MTDSQPEQPHQPQQPQQRREPGQPPYQAPQGQPPYPSGPWYPPYGPAVPMSPEDQRLWATLAHLGGLMFGFLAPLVVYLVTKDRGPFVRSQAAEALNFRITVDVGLLVSAVLVLVLIGIPLLVVIVVGSVVLQIVAAIATNRGEDYRYPVNLRLVH